MKKELPQGVVIGIIAVAVLIAVGIIGSMFMNRGPGNMTQDEVKRAEMEAAAGNARMQGYIPAGTPGAPPSGSEKPAEMMAREKAASGGQ